MRHLLCRPCQRPAIQGCLAVAHLSQAQAPPLPFSCQTAAAVLKEMLDGLNVQHLKQLDREACFKLLTCLLQVPCSRNFRLLRTMPVDTGN